MSGFQHCFAVGTVFLKCSCLNHFITVLCQNRFNISDTCYRSFRFKGACCSHPGGWGMLPAPSQLVSAYPVQNESGVAWFKKNRAAPWHRDGAGRAAAACARVWACFPLIARGNSKYPKPPLVPNFSYLNHSTFHTISNVGLKEFLLLLVPLSY